DRPREDIPDDHAAEPEDLVVIFIREYFPFQHAARPGRGEAHVLYGDDAVEVAYGGAAELVAGGLFHINIVSDGGADVHRLFRRAGGRPERGARVSSPGSSPL